MGYAFGDSDIAARRLAILSEVFAESSRAFLQGTVDRSLCLAIDLGCGPGCSTRFLSDVVRCDRTVGLDNSEHFISIARESAGERLSFYTHDFTVVPFPEGPSDLLFSRFEPTHVEDPGRVIEKWATQLAPGGLMLLEETEWIETSSAAFASYLGIVEAMLRHQSNILYIGPSMNDLHDAPLKRRTSDVRRLCVCNRDAAAMFFLNIQTWKHHPFVQANYDSTMIDGLEQELGALATEPGQATEIEWGLRQIAFERQ